MSRKKTTVSEIKHPTYRHDTGKTPSEDLRVCDHCKISQWYIGGYGGDIKYHRCTDRKERRMRKATDKERAEAQKVLAESGGLDNEFRERMWGKEASQPRLLPVAFHDSITVYPPKSLLYFFEFSGPEGSAHQAVSLKESTARTFVENVDGVEADALTVERVSVIDCKTKEMRAVPFWEN